MVQSQEVHKFVSYVPNNPFEKKMSGSRSRVVVVVHGMMSKIGFSIMLSIWENW